MRTTVTLDDQLVEELRGELGIDEVSTLVRRALVEMRQRLAAERLIEFGGSDPDAWIPDRRRPPSFDPGDE
jgi:Arc/MetJ family transcription regulator